MERSMIKASSINHIAPPRRISPLRTFTMDGKKLLTIQDRVNVIGDLHTKRMSYRAIARMTGMSKSQVGNYVKLWLAPEYVLIAINTGHISSAKCLELITQLGYRDGARVINQYLTALHKRQHGQTRR